MIFKETDVFVFSNNHIFLKICVFFYTSKTFFTPPIFQHQQYKIWVNYQFTWSDILEVMFFILIDAKIKVKCDSKCMSVSNSHITIHFNEKYSKIWKNLSKNCHLQSFDIFEKFSLPIDIDRPFYSFLCRQRVDSQDEHIF